MSAPPNARADPSPAGATPVAAYTPDWRHLVVALAFALLLAAAASGGPDYSRYEDWGLAGLSGTLWDARVYTISPLGVPLMMWSHGTGFVFAVADLASPASLDFRSSAMLAGWLASLAMLAAMLRVLWLLAGGDAVLTLLGVALFLVATHGGYFSHVHASESLALACTALVVWLAFEPRPADRLTFLTAGLTLALLVTIKPYWVVYGIGTLAVLSVRARRAGAGGGEVLVRLTLVAVPCAVAVLQAALTNRWMTGSWLRSPYQFGDAGFRSFDFADPELAAVLLHPWHGLLSYHPFYALGAIAVLAIAAGAGAARTVWVARRGPSAGGHERAARASANSDGAMIVIQPHPGGGALEHPAYEGVSPPILDARLFFALAAFAMAANLYLQAAWVVWWLGRGTFGMRGMAPAAAVVVPAFVLVARRLTWDRPAMLGAWTGLAVLCALWSTTLLAAGVEPQFHTWAQMLAGQRATLAGLTVWGYLAPALTCLCGLTVLLAGVWRKVGGLRRAVALSSLVLLALAFVYLGGEALWVIRERSASTSIAAALLLVAAIAATITLRRRHLPRRPSALIALAAAQAITLTIASLLFFRLAARVESDIAAGRRPPHNYAYVNTFSTRDMRESCNEYRHLPAFRDKREALKAFLIRSGVDAASFR